MRQPMGYLPATRHPWPCLLFILPLLVLYEAGVVALGGLHPETVRNGADHWLRTQLMTLGVPYSWVPPLVLALFFAGWCWARRAERPGDLVGVLSGMVIESVTFALGLWGVSRALAPLLQGLGVELSVDAARDDALRLVITYLGAGVYEEALFRLLLFSALARLMRLIEVPGVLALVLAAVASATLFSSAHHWGPHGQAYSNYLFLFRLVAGLYFATLYHVRGFGIAVGAHACYNVMVSVGVT